MLTCLNPIGLERGLAIRHPRLRIMGGHHVFVGPLAGPDKCRTNYNSWLTRLEEPVEEDCIFELRYSLLITSVTPSGHLMPRRHACHGDMSASCRWVETMR